MTTLIAGHFAPLHAPRCNFARVFVNGKYLGIYSNVEPVDKVFLKRNFESIKGTLFEGAFQDFHPQTVESIEAKTDKKSPDRSKLRELAKLLRNFEAVEMEKLAELVDVEGFLKFWVAEMLLGHWDGYAGNHTNFFVYDNPRTARLEYLPWGADQSFANANPFISEKAPKIIHAKGRLCAALYSDPTHRQRYLNLVAKQLDAWWQTSELLAELERAAGLIRPHIQLRQTDFGEAMEGLRTYIERTPGQVRGELKNPPGKWLVSVPQEESAPLNAPEPKAPR